MLGRAALGPRAVGHGLVRGRQRVGRRPVILHRTNTGRGLGRRVGDRRIVLGPKTAGHGLTHGRNIGERPVFLNAANAGCGLVVRRETVGRGLGRKIGDRRFTLGPATTGRGRALGRNVGDRRAVLRPANAGRGLVLGRETVGRGLGRKVGGCRVVLRPRVVGWGLVLPCLRRRRSVRRVCVGGWGDRDFARGGGRWPLGDWRRVARLGGRRSRVHRRLGRPLLPADATPPGRPFGLLSALTWAGRLW